MKNKPGCRLHEPTSSCSNSPDGILSHYLALDRDLRLDTSAFVNSIFLRTSGLCYESFTLCITIVRYAPNCGITFMIVIDDTSQSLTIVM